MRKSVLIFILFILFDKLGYARDSETGINDIKMGDNVGHLRIDINLNGLKVTKKISDLCKDGGVLINFWATWCSPCVKELKELNRFVGQSPGLKVLSVTYEDSLVVRSFIAKERQMYEQLLIISNDSVFRRLFPHRIIPHNVWINRAGVVVAITGYEQISQENLSRLISDSSLKFGIKKDNVSFNFSKPYHVADSSIGYRSIIAPYDSGIGSGLLYNSNGVSKRFFAWNLRFLDFLWLAYTRQKSSDINWKMIEIRTKDSSRYLSPNDTTHEPSRSFYQNHNIGIDQKLWNRNNLYTYDLIIPVPINNNIFSKYMFQDVERYFNIDCDIVEKKMLCYIVSAPRKVTKLATALQVEATPSIRLGKSYLRVVNSTLDDVLMVVANRFGEYPLINRTGVNVPIDLKIEISNGGEITFKVIMDKLKELDLFIEKREDVFPILLIDDTLTF